MSKIEENLQIYEELIITRKVDEIIMDILKENIGKDNMTKTVMDASLKYAVAEMIGHIINEDYSREDLLETYNQVADYANSQEDLLDREKIEINLLASAIMEVDMILKEGGLKGLFE